jgi:hypothetical protein
MPDKDEVIWDSEGFRSLPTRTQNALLAGGAQIRQEQKLTALPEWTWRSLVNLGKRRLRTFRGMGQSGISALERVLNGRGLTLNGPDEKKIVGFIDAEPKWIDLLPLLVSESTHAHGDAAKVLAWSELCKMARAADAYRALQKAGVFTLVAERGHATCSTMWASQTCDCGFDRAMDALRKAGEVP